MSININLLPVLLHRSGLDDVHIIISDIVSNCFVEVYAVFSVPPALCNDPDDEDVVKIILPQVSQGRLGRVARLTIR